MTSIDHLDDAGASIEWGRGDTDPKTFEFDDAGTPVDISTWSFKMTINEDANPVGVATQQFTMIGAIIDGPGGKVAFTPAPGDTDIPPATYFYDIQRDISGNSIKTLIKGLAEIVQDVTK